MTTPAPASPPPGLSAADERHHAVGPEPWWNESWYFDFATTDGSLGGYVRIGLYPNHRAAWYWACLVGEGRPLVIVVDHTVTPPRADSLEVRAEGLWADHTVEVPFDHMTLGCEAFALGLDDPAEMYGDPPASGCRSGSTSSGTPTAPPTPTRRAPPATRCRAGCTARSSSATSRSRSTAVGQRDHSWGVRDWWTLGWTWTAGWLEDGTRFHGTAVRLGGDTVPYHPGYVQPPGGPLAGVEHTGSAPTLGAHGLPTADTVEVGDLRLDVEPVAFAPVLLDDGTGRLSRFPRALCRFHEPSTGRRGAGWTEWNQPQPGG